MKQKPPQALAIPWPWIAGLVALCIAAAFFLMPDKRRLLERQIRDGRAEQALETLRGIPPEERRTAPEFYALTEARLKRQTATTPEQKQDALRSAAQAAADFKFSELFLQELTAALSLANAPAEALTVIAPHLQSAPADAQIRIASDLAAKALAAGRPAEGAAIYSNLWSRVRSETATRELLRLLRQADQATNALAVLDAFAAERGSLPETFARERVELLRASGRPAEAFETVKNLLRSAEGDERPELSDLFVTLALENNRAAEALPELKRRAIEEARPDPKLLRRLADTAQAAGETELARNTLLQLSELQPENKPLRFEIGQLFEWTNNPDAAFTNYLASLAPEDRRALPRLKELASPLGREEQFLDALLANPKLIGTAEDHLLTAELATLAARYSEAKAAYREALRDPGAGYDLHLDYAKLLMNLFEFDEAARVAEAARKLKPGELAPRKILAEIAYRNGDFDGALARYRQLAEETKDEEALANYVSLADSLGETESLIAGLQGQVRSGEAGAYTYERLAFALSARGRTNDYVQALRDGLRAHPRLPELTLKLGYALANRGEPDAAAELLSSHPDLSKNANLATLYLALLIRGQKLKEADGFLRSPLPPAWLAESETLALRAQVAEGLNRLPEALHYYEQLHARDPDSSYYALNRARLLAANGRPKEALKLLQPFLAEPGEETLALAAQIYSEAGDYKRAEEWQRRLLALSPTPQRWGFLGDILLSRGDKTNARRAYQRAADAMLSRMAATK